MAKQQEPNNILGESMSQAFRGLTPRRTKAILAIAFSWLGIAILFQLVFAYIITPTLNDPIIVTLSGPKNPVSGAAAYTAHELIATGWIYTAIVAALGIITGLGVAIKKPAFWVTGALFVYVIGIFYVGRYLGVSLGNWWGLGQSMLQVIITILLLGGTFYLYLWAVVRDIREDKLVK